MTREEMMTALAEGTCRVIFKKANGEERDMLCTREMRNIPEEYRPKYGENYTDEVIRVFDLDKGEWRSFKVDNVISFSAANK